MKIDVTRMFVRCTLVFAIAAAGVLASGCATEQATKKTPEQLRAEEEAARKAREEAERKKWTEVGQKADALFQQKTTQSVEEAIRLWESMPEAMRPMDKIAEAKKWLADTRAKAAAEAEARAKAEAEAEARRLATVYFDYDKYNIRDDQKSALEKNAEKLKARSDLQATLEGHCDERGTIEYNMALGQKRADSAKAFLVRAGIDAKRLTTVSYGKERPADSGHDENSWAKNRRVEFKTESKAP